MNYIFEEVMGHIEVRTPGGKFLFSADNYKEAMSETRLYEEEQAAA